LILWVPRHSIDFIPAPDPDPSWRLFFHHHASRSALADPHENFKQDSFNTFKKDLQVTCQLQQTNDTKVWRTIDAWGHGYVLLEKPIGQR
jgi:hypothetical protein